MNLGYEHTVPTSTVFSMPGVVRAASITCVPISRLDEVQRRRLGLVVADPADAGGEVDDGRGAVLGEHVLGGAGGR